jgi:hypothetical protein
MGHTHKYESFFVPFSLPSLRRPPTHLKKHPLGDLALPRSRHDDFTVAEPFAPVRAQHTAQNRPARSTPRSVQNPEKKTKNKCKNSSVIAPNAPHESELLRLSSISVCGPLRLSRRPERDWRTRQARAWWSGPCPARIAATAGTSAGTSARWVAEPPLRTSPQRSHPPRGPPKGRWSRPKELGGRWRAGRPPRYRAPSSQVPAHNFFFF